ncbi:D-lactate dehydrogenase [Penicillium chermesinum]|nr:D-lactate dehydrogenase [Penicillium chermesinum]
MARPQPAIRGALRGLRARSTLVPNRFFSVTARCPAEKPQQSFKSQLYESTQQRLKRERAEQERFAQYQTRSSTGQYAAVIFSLLFFSSGAYYLGSLKPDSFPKSSTSPLADLEPPAHNISQANLQAAWADFVEVPGKRTSLPDLEIWSRTPVQTGHLTRARTTKSLSLFFTRRPRRSLEGHYASTRGGVCIDFRRMDRILQLNKADLDVAVQPALGWEDLNDELKKDGLFFPRTPPGSYDWWHGRNGLFRNECLSTRQRPRKSSAGYDLTRLFIGSEGTLGLVTEATLKLTVSPQSTNVAVATFPSIQTAAECVTGVVGAGIPVAGVEILDDVQMKFHRTPSAVKEQIGMVQKIASKASGKSFEFARGEEEMAELWSARKEALWSVMAMRRSPQDRIWTTDVAVPMSKLPEIIEATKEDMTKSGLLAGICGHVGDGNFHAIILFNESERKMAEGVVHRMVKRAVELEGTVTGEHGVGLVKRDYLAHELGETTVDAMRRLKLAFDPLRLLNCDKVVRIEQPAPGEVKEW